MGGGGCRSWEENIYWTHFQFIHFTQFLRTDFHQQLALPKTFSDNIKKKLPESVSLKGPGGVLWNIELTTRDDTLYFTNGWQQFVKDHSLKENDFLVFKYNGESSFDVLIFDGESFCEKAACYFVQKCGNAANTEQGGGCSSKKRDTDNSVEEVNTPSNGVDEGVSPEKSLRLNGVRVPFAVPIETTNGKISNAGVEFASAIAVRIETTNGKTYNAGVESVSAEQFMSDAVTDTEPRTGPGVESASAGQFMSDAVTDTEPRTGPSQTAGKRTRRPVYADMSVPSRKRGRPPKTSNSHERALNWVSDAEHSPKASPKVRSGTQELYTSNRRPVTNNEIENTLHLAQATCTEDTLLVTMRPSHVYKRFFVSFPNKWILNHISPASQDMVLRTGQRDWVGRYLYHNIRNNGGLTGGWKYFALDNNLEEFDVCLFKPAGYMHNNTLILEMTIFRVVEEITPLTAVHSPGNKRSIKRTPISAVKTELKSYESPVKKRGVKKASTSAVQTKLDSIEGV